MAATLAQPSGLTGDKEWLYFADSESSSIRRVRFLDGMVETVVGGDTNPRNLFAFGDVDGIAYEAKLQHPLGVHFDRDRVWVADTYNHKIRWVTPDAATIDSFVGDKTLFGEPSSVARLGDRLLVTDTNRHRVRTIDLKTKAVGTLELTGVPKVAAGSPGPGPRHAVPAVRRRRVAPRGEDRVPGDRAGWLEVPGRARRRTPRRRNRDADQRPRNRDRGDRRRPRDHGAVLPVRDGRHLPHPFDRVPRHRAYRGGAAAKNSCCAISFCPSSEPGAARVVLWSMEQRIREKLDALEKNHDVRVLYAAESGSRAWGFASADSDWDVRFLYARPVDWYLTLRPGRDVIELPIEGDLDISGWDIKKALSLFRKGNCVILEWLHSPIVYRETSGFAEAVREASRRFFPPKAALYHYLHMAEGNFREFLNRDRVRRKKYLYVLRPLLACSWIRRTGERPPVEFRVLVDTEIGTQPIRAVVDDLLEKKASGELGEGPRIPELNAYLTREMEATAAAAAAALPAEPPPWADLDALFRKTLRES